MLQVGATGINQPSMLKHKSRIKERSVTVKKIVGHRFEWYLFSVYFVMFTSSISLYI
jgi:hypothetical protein